MTREPHSHRAEVIALLGIDGSGKTTLAHRLVERIGARGHAAAYRGAEKRPQRARPRDAGAGVRGSRRAYGCRRRDPDGGRHRLAKPAGGERAAAPPALGAARVDTRGGNPKTLAFLEGFDEAYRALPEAVRYVVLDGTAFPDPILEEAWAWRVQRYPALA